MDGCTCADPPSPGTVRIAVFCIDCRKPIGEITGTIDEQIAQLKNVAEDMHTVREIRQIATELWGPQAPASHRHCDDAHEDYEPGSVTYTEVHGGEGFRPFG